MLRLQLLFWMLKIFQPSSFFHIEFCPIFSRIIYHPIILVRLRSSTIAQLLWQFYFPFQESQWHPNSHVLLRHTNFKTVLPCPYLKPSLPPSMPLPHHHPVPHSHTRKHIARACSLHISNWSSFELIKIVMFKETTSEAREQKCFAWIKHFEWSLLLFYNMHSGSPMFQINTPCYIRSFNCTLIDRHIVSHAIL